MVGTLTTVAIRWTRSSRLHRIGRAHALHVIRTAAETTVLTARGGEGRSGVGTDDRGVDYRRK